MGSTGRSFRSVVQEGQLLMRLAMSIQEEPKVDSENDCGQRNLYLFFDAFY